MKFSAWWQRRLSEIAYKMKFRVDSTYDIKRVLRMPGFTNYKYKPYKHVFIERKNHSYINFQTIADEYEGYKNSIPESNDSIGKYNAVNLGGQPRSQSFNGGVAIYIGDELILRLMDDEIKASPPMDKITSAINDSQAFNTIWNSDTYSSPSERDMALCGVMHSLYFTAAEMASTLNYLRNARQETSDKIHAHALTIVKTQMDREKHERTMSTDKDEVFASLSQELFQHEMSGAIASLSSIVRYETGESPTYVISIDIDGEIYNVNLIGSRKLLKYEDFRIAMTDALPPKAAAWLQKNYKAFVWAGHTSSMLQHTEVERVPLAGMVEEMSHWLTSMCNDFVEHRASETPDSEKDTAKLSTINGSSVYYDKDHLWFSITALKEFVKRKFGETLSTKELSERLTRVNAQYTKISYTHPIKDKRTSGRVWRIHESMLEASGD